MNRNFISLTAVDGQMYTINSNFITRISWNEDRDNDGIVDMIYLAEGAECAEIALAPQSESSKRVFANITAGTTYNEQVARYLYQKP